MVRTANLTIYQGDDYSAVVTVTNGSPPDQVIANYTAQAQIRTGPADDVTTVTAEFTTSVSSPYVYLTLPHAVTETLTVQKYVWDLHLIDPNGLITTVLAGSVQIILEVTR